MDGLKDFSSPDNVFVLLILALGVTPTAIHDTSVHICWAEGVWLVEERDHRKEYRANWLRGVPTLAGQFARLRVVDGRVQDRYAKVTILQINIYVILYCLPEENWVQLTRAYIYFVLPLKKTAWNRPLNKKRSNIIRWVALSLNELYFANNSWNRFTIMWYRW